MYQESSDGKEYFDGKKWHVKKSVSEKESKEFDQHNKVIGGYRIVNNNSNNYHQTAIARDIANVKKRRG
jgi:hypothetical protein